MRYYRKDNSPVGSESVDDYFGWLCSFVLTDKRMEDDYSMLMHELFSRTFISSVKMDENRAADGQGLRYDYIKHNSPSMHLARTQPELPLSFIKSKCTLLEMMIALAIRMESDVMADSDAGNRVPFWFSCMIESLGLVQMTNDNYNERYVKRTLLKLDARSYKPNGRGGLFYIPNTREDLTKVDYWFQAMWYLVKYEEE